MWSFSNIEKSGFRHGEYVGYADGVWRIRKVPGGWRASKGGVTITRRLLSDISEALLAVPATAKTKEVA